VIGMVTLATDPASAEFDALVDSHRAVVVDFYATWCGPCKAYSPRFAQAARDARRRWPDAPVAFATVDIDLHGELKRRYHVHSVPTTLVLERRRGLLGQRVAEVARLTGAIRPSDLAALIERLCA
jgi:thioredoxin-like negative regulator of GroEL